VFVSGWWLECRLPPSPLSPLSAAAAAADTELPRSAASKAFRTDSAFAFASSTDALFEPRLAERPNGDISLPVAAAVSVSAAAVSVSAAIAVAAAVVSVVCVEKGGVACAE